MRQTTIRRAAAFMLMAFIVSQATAAMADSFERRIASIPNPRAVDGGWVHDGPGLLGDRKDKINAEIDKLEKETSAEIAVVILHTVGDNIPKNIATALFNAWGVGKDGKDNGVLVLHVLDQRRVEIETGYGMESILTDAHCQKIIDLVAIPFFKKSSLADGHLEIVRSLARGIRSGGDFDKLIAKFIYHPGTRVDEVPDQPVAQHFAEFGYTAEEHPVLSWMFIIGAGLWLLWLLIYGVFRLVNRDPYARYRVYNTLGGAMQWGGTSAVGGGMSLTEILQYDSMWSIIPGILSVMGVGFRRSQHLNALRAKPRKCKECDSTEEMKKLGEKADDAYLEDGQVSEERIESMDYDVYTCNNCDAHRIEAYKGTKSASKCEQCKYKTWRQTSRKTVRAATYSSQGLERITYRCAHCNFSKTVNRTIAQKQRASTSSSSGGSSYSGGSSSSGGGSSFGGGSSGGGGAGGSY